MVMLYFSGTGNSKFVAENFSKKMDASCYSIEERLAFTTVIDKNKVIAFCFPVYGSCVPRIMREFIVQYKDSLVHKELIIFCTQMMFSGDGAHALFRLLPENNDIMYAEHFNMPNNISNFWLFPIRDSERIRKVVAVNKKINSVCEDIKKGKSKKRGWGKISRFLGTFQNVSWPVVEQKKSNSFQTDESCNLCGLCVKKCPVLNLSMGENTILQKGNCILCFRCVNICPQKSISVLLNVTPKNQYKGPL